jgi:hypothetical protein
MNNFAKSVSDSIIRLTNYELTNTNEPRVTIYELKLDSKLIDIKKLSYLVDSNHNFSLVKESLIPLKKSEIKTLNNTFNYCLKENIQYSFKTNQHNPFLIEYKLMPHYEVIERSGGLDADMNKHYSVYQSLVSIVNSIGSLSDSKLEKRYRNLKK